MNMIEKRKAMAGQGGFTLIELLVVVAILAILAGVAVFAVGNLTSDAGISACKTELSTVKTAISASRATSAADTPSTFLEAPAAMKYFDAPVAGTGAGKWDAARKLTAEVPTADCPAIDEY